jgi:Na+-transporting methylmalonyl-CoA/oxaloacetate decarboxylase gamma subunit
VAYTNVAQQPGSPGDAALWRTMGLVLFVLSLVIALAGILSALFEQAERRADEARRARRKP